MTFFSLENISNIFGLIYLCAVLLIGTVSLITLRVFFNNAEKPSIASTIALVYFILFVLISVIGFGVLTTS